MSGLLFSVMLTMAAPLQAAGPSPEGLGNLIDQMVKRKMANLGKQMGVVINLSGRQRMLTQKMTKEFLLIAAGISVQENQANLQKTVALFDRTLKGLRDGDVAQRLPGTPLSDIRAQLEIIEQRWNEYRPVLEQQDYSGAQVLRAAELNLPLLKEMNTAVKMYEVLSDSN